MRAVVLVVMLVALHACGPGDPGIAAGGIDPNGEIDAVDGANRNDPGDTDAERPSADAREDALDVQTDIEADADDGGSVHDTSPFDAASDAAFDLGQDVEPSDVPEVIVPAPCPDGQSRNACGGCVELDQVRGDLCGCRVGHWTCDNEDELSCRTRDGQIVALDRDRDGFGGTRVRGDIACDGSDGRLVFNDDDCDDDDSSIEPGSSLGVCDESGTAALVCGASGEPRFEPCSYGRCEEGECRACSVLDGPRCLSETRRAWCWSGVVRTQSCGTDQQCVDGACVDGPGPLCLPGDIVCAADGAPALGICLESGDVAEPGPACASREICYEGHCVGQQALAWTSQPSPTVPPTLYVARVSGTWPPSFEEVRRIDDIGVPDDTMVWHGSQPVIALSRWTAAPARDVVLVDVTTGEVTVLGGGWLAVNQLMWSPASDALAVVGRRDDATDDAVWWYDLTTTPPALSLEARPRPSYPMMWWEHDGLCWMTRLKFSRRQG